VFRNIGEKGLKLHVSLFLFITYLPLILVVILSFNDSKAVGFPLRGFTLQWWEMFFGSASAVGALRNSLIIGAVAALVSTAIGLLAAFALVRHFFHGKNLITYSLLLPLCLPAILMGIGILLLLRTILNVELSIFTIILGHILYALPATTLVLMARLIGFDRSLEEAACDLGANEFTTFRKITLPIIMPGFFVALFIAFTYSLQDVPLALFLGKEGATIPIYIYGMLRRWYGIPVSLAMSALMVMIGAVILLVSIVSGQRSGKTAEADRHR